MAKDHVPDWGRRVILTGIGALAVSVLLVVVTLAGLGAMVTRLGGELRTAAGDFVAVDERAADQFMTTGKPGE